ncbi:MAG: hypothetical protein ACRELC_12155 [Gemmatimonadota bacterium]
MGSQLRTMSAVIAALCAVALGARDVAAQACLGNGALDGQGYLSGRASFTDGAWAPGGSLGYNAPGPITVEAGVDHTLFDNVDIATTAVSGALAVEIPNLSVSICPTVGVAYQWLSNEGELEGLGVDADGVVVGGGLVLGGRIESPGSDFAFIPRASANVVHNRATFSAGGESVTGSDTYGVFGGGVTLAVGNFFFGPSASISTLDGADPVFGAQLGVAF